jgi:hypothetical protein
MLLDSISRYPFFIQRHIRFLNHGSKDLMLSLGRLGRMLADPPDQVFI